MFYWRFSGMNKNENRAFLLSLFMLFFSSVMVLSAQESAGENAAGLWATVDDETNEVTSLFLLYIHEDALYGRCLAVLRDGNDDTWEHPVRRVADRQDYPYAAGLDMISAMQWNSRKEKWTGGTILDPDAGKVYDCDLWRDGENLKVNPHVWLFGRVLIWIPARWEDYPQLRYPDQEEFVPNFWSP